MRDDLLENIQRQAGNLKRAQTKEVSATPAASDIECIAKIYTDCGGDFAKIAEKCGANVELLKKTPPEDATDFGKKLLEGIYTGICWADDEMSILMIKGTDDDDGDDDRHLTMKRVHSHKIPTA